MRGDPLTEQVISLSKRVREEAVALDKISGAALAGFVGCATVFGVVLGGLWWAPAAMGGSMFAYKAIMSAFHYRMFTGSQKILLVAAKREEMERIHRADLPLSDKQALALELSSQPLQIEAPEQEPQQAAAAAKRRMGNGL